MTRWSQKLHSAQHSTTFLLIINIYHCGCVLFFGCAFVNFLISTLVGLTY